LDERLVDEAESGDVTDEAAGTVAGAEGSADTGVVAAVGLFRMEIFPGSGAASDSTLKLERRDEMLCRCIVSNG